MNKFNNKSLKKAKNKTLIHSWISVIKANPIRGCGFRITPKNHFLTLTLDQDGI